MKAWRLVTIGFCLLIYICDGMDIASIAYAAPMLMREWGLSPATMGLVLSAGTLGLAVGASLVAALADRFGRRIVMIVALAEVAASMLLIATVDTAPALIVLRFAAGVGVGALVPTLNVMMIEYAPGRVGNVFLSIGHVGYALGAVVGAATATAVMGPLGWRGIFVVSGLITAAMALLSIVLLPESLSFLLSRQPRGALARANRLLRRLGEPALAALPARGGGEGRRAGALRHFVSRQYLAPTLLLWVVSFAYYFTSYFLTSWTPQVLVAAGLSERTAISSGMVTGAGSALGALAIGFLSVRFDSRRLTSLAFALTAACLIMFATVGSDALLLLSAAGLAMLVSQASYTGMVIVTARFYPPEMRATGVGFMISVGRIGAIAGPLLGGVLMGLHWGRPAYFSVFALTCLIGAGAVLVRPAARA